MAASTKRRLDDKHLKALRELQASVPSNKHCFDCHQRGPTYLNMTVGSFVCTSCSGILRGLNPPHRVKSISMATFTSDEIEFIKSHGNEYCTREWMGTYDNQPPIESETKDEQRIKDFMAMKYERKRWYVDPSNFRNTVSSESTASQQQQQQSASPATSTSYFEMSKYSSSSSSSSTVGNNVRHGSSQNNQTITTARPVTQSASFPPPSILSTNKMVSMDLLSDMSADPFASSALNNSVANNVKGGFANFDNFNSAFSPRSSVPSSVTNVGGPSVPVSTPTPHQLPQKDKYAALADLDNLFHCNNVSLSNPSNQGKGTTTSAWTTNGTTPSIHTSGNNITNPSANFITAPISSNPFTGTNFASQAWDHNNATTPVPAQGNPFMARFPPPSGKHVGGDPSPPSSFGLPFHGQSPNMPTGSFSPGQVSWSSPNQMQTTFTSPTNGNFDPTNKMALAARYATAGWQSTSGNPFVASPNSGPPRPSSNNPFL